MLVAKVRKASVLKPKTESTFTTFKGWGVIYLWVIYLYVIYLTCDLPICDLPNM